MYWLNSYRMKLVIVGVVAAMAIGGERAMADFTFGRPFNLGPTVNSPQRDIYPCISLDGLELYFNSWRPGVNSSSWDIYVAKRATIEDDWEPPVCLGPNVNSSRDEYMPRLSPDGLELYYDVRNRPGGYGSFDVWVNKRPTKDSAWGTSENFGPLVNTAGGDSTVWITSDDLELYFSSARPASGLSPAPIYVSTRATTEDEWGEPVRLGRPVDGPSADLIASISADGLVLFITEDELLGRYRPDGYGGIDIWLTTRANRSSPWGVPVNLGPIINTSGDEGGGCVSPDGSTFYFDAVRPEGYGRSDLYQAPIITIVDFNGDGIVDAADMCIMFDHWGEDYSLCDIGPMPWGDGMVDVEDLKVLAEHLFEEVNDSTLIAHWPLDEAQGVIAYDSVADCDGTLMGGPSWQPDSGMVDGALELDGIDDYVSTPFVLNPTDGKFSVLTWVKGGAPGQVVLSQMGGSNWLCTDSVEGNLMTEIKAYGRGATGTLLSQTVITDGKWHRIGLVWDGSQRTLYVDDIAVAQDAQPDLEALQKGLYIGTGNAMEAGTYWSGLIDDVRIYNRAINP